MKANIKTALLCITIFAVGALYQFFALELSYCDYTEWVGIEPVNFAVGYLTILFLSFVLLLICNRPWLALLMSTIITTATALANYYILETRGAPFSFVQLENITTALHVISSYRFELTPRVQEILIIAVMLLIASVLLRTKKGSRRYSGIVTMVLGVIMVYSYNTIIPTNVVGWSWDASVSKYGYTTCLTKCTLQSTVSVVPPETYNESTMRQYVAEYETVSPEANSTPDIIFILNESWYDLNQVTDVQANENAFSYIYSLENSLQGRCVVPGAGGGTNVSEYEYLTGNTLSLSPNCNPFNTIDISHGNSFVTHLESLGYYSLATHTEEGANYSRDMAFPALGFDTVHFREDYSKPDWYGHRFYYPTDTWAFRHLIQWYEEMNDAPRVMYLLTIQNHGGYESLKESEYLVQTKNDYGEYTNQVNEFLTCMSLTDKGFETLVDYFSQVDRDVIICMVGDHAPIFALDIAEKDKGDMELLLRSVPYVIWSNHINLRDETAEKNISLHFMPAYVMDVANVRMNTYFETANELRKNVPVLTSYNVYLDNEGNYYRVGEESIYKDQVDCYLGLAYANMKKQDFMMDGSYTNKLESAAATTPSSVTYKETAISQ